MKYEEGMKLQLVIADDIRWAKEGDSLIFLRKSKKYDDDKGLVVVDENDKTHCIKEYRVAEYGNEKEIAKCKANAPKFYIVLQDSCRNVQNDRAIVGIEGAECLARDIVTVGEPQTIYELKPVKKVSRDTNVTEA